MKIQMRDNDQNESSKKERTDAQRQTSKKSTKRKKNSAFLPWHMLGAFASFGALYFGEKK